MVDTTEKNLRFVRLSWKCTSMTGLDGAYRPRRRGERPHVRVGPQLLDQLGGREVEHPADRFAASPFQQRRCHLLPVRDVERTGPGSRIRRSTLAASGTGSGAHMSPKRRCAPPLARRRFHPRSITTAG